MIHIILKKKKTGLRRIYLWLSISNIIVLSSNIKNNPTHNFIQKSIKILVIFLDAFLFSFVNLI